MRLSLLGTTGYHPNQRRHTACLMIPEMGIVLDAGTGMYRVGQHLCTSNLDIFLTHAHLDHIAGLPMLIDSIFTDEVDIPVTVYGRAETLKAIQDHLFNWVIWPDFAVLPNPENPMRWPKRTMVASETPQRRASSGTDRKGTVSRFSRR